VSEPAVQWKQLRRFLNRNGFEIDHDGGDKLVSKDGVVHRIGHVFSTKNTTQVSDGHLQALHRKFGLTRKQILEG